MRSFVSFMLISGLALSLTAGCSSRVTTDNGLTESGQNDVDDNLKQTSSETATDTVPMRSEAAPPRTDGKLAIGDPAPELAIAEWVTGEALDDFSDGDVYVVEFWATWCGPCKSSMPHLSQLQDSYAQQVKFIGVTDEPRDTVEGFLSEDVDDESTWRDVVTYTLAIDDGNRTNGAYMRAAGQSGIPTAFIVGRTRHVEWIGHPMAIDAPLEQVVAGTWDRTAARERFVAEQQAKEEMMAAMRGLQNAQKTEDWAAAIEIVDGLLAKRPEAANFAMLKFNLLLRAGDTEAAYQCADQLSQANWDDANMLNGLAWSVATEIPKDLRDLEFALKIAQRADEVTNGENASVIDTLARVYFEMGDLDQAIALQTKAVEAAGGSAAEYQSSLDEYTRQRDAEGATDASEETDEEMSPAGDDSDADLDSA